MRATAFWITAFCLLALVQPARAQVGDSKISGLVTYSDGQPANARVFVGFQGKYRQVATRFRAGKNSGYTIGGLLPGRYELVVTAPAGKPQRIWGVTVGSFDDKQVNVVLQRCAAGEERFYTESGIPLQADMPHGWQGGWLQGTIMNAAGAPVEGTLNFYRGTVLYLSLPTGAPGMPAYFETRTIPPGTWDMVFIPSPSSRLKRARIEKVVVDPNSRTVLGTLTMQAGTETDAPAIIPVPERKSEPILATIPRKKRPDPSQ
jgi:hypothetical protein